MTKLYKKRLEILHTIGEVNISKSGNHYIVLDSFKATNQRSVSAYNVTKSTLKNIGVTKEYKKSYKTIVLLTKDNKIKIKDPNKNSFVQLSVKHFKTGHNKIDLLKKLFFYNKRCEWIINDPHFKELILSYNLIKSFKSLKELLISLNYTAKLEDTSKVTNLIAGYNFKNKTSLINSFLRVIEDCVVMIQNTGRVDYYNSDKTIDNIHNELVSIVNEKDLLSYSDTPVYPSFAENITQKLKLSGISFKVLNSPRALALNGRQQNHCISSRSNDLDNNLFYAIYSEDKMYSLQCDNQKIIEFKGKYNSPVPEELVEAINSALYSKVEVLEYTEEIF